MDKEVTMNHTLFYKFCKFIEKLLTWALQF